MSKKLKVTLTWLAGLLVVAVTLGLYFLLCLNKTSVSGIGISFVLLAEFILFGFIIGMGLVAKGKNKLFLKAGITSILSLYLAAAIIMFMLSGMFDNSKNVFWSIEITAFAAMVVLSILVVLFSIKIGVNDRYIASSRRLMQMCERRISDLLSLYKNNAYAPQLAHVLEMLKYADKIGTSSVDEKIVNGIENLERALSSSEPNADSVLNELTAFISQRNAEIAESKRGGF
ncbi:MAG: hypothetical protein FWF47_01160 [Clostridia bacterium]|nr:hypothetical protein [Clostridia bacterium]